MDVVAFRDLLEKVAKPDGTIPTPDIPRVAEGLAQVWTQLEGSRAAGMRDWKVTRMEEPCWHPPQLSFIIERHGAIAAGSTRAELQGWGINLETGQATHVAVGHRQLYRSAKRVDVRPFAQDAAAAVFAGISDDRRLRWSKDLNAVTVFASRSVDLGDYQQTQAGRRRRFFAALDGIMEEHGWGGGHGWYTRPPEGEAPSRGPTADL